MGEALKELQVALAIYVSPIEVARIMATGSMYSYLSNSDKPVGETLKELHAAPVALQSVAFPSESENKGRHAALMAVAVAVAVVMFIEVCVVRVGNVCIYTYVCRCIL